MTTQTNNEKLTAFATAVGTDIKQLRTAISDKVDTATMTNAIDAAKTAVKNDILGGASSELDTLKEIADAMANLGQDSSGAVVQKLTAHHERLEAIEMTLGADLVGAYNAAKAGVGGV